LLCFECTSTGKPIVYHVVPDIRIPVHTSVEIMDLMIEFAPADQYTLVADAFFPSLGWIQSHPTIDFIFSLSPQDLPFFDLFSHGLEYHNYRIFKKDNLLISIWVDNKTMICISNCFVAENSEEGRYRGSNFSKPILSVDDIKLLAKLSSNGLKSLAKRCGVSQGS